MLTIDEELLREAIEFQVKFWRDRNLLSITDFDLETLSIIMSGYIQGYCQLNTSSENDLQIKYDNLLEKMQTSDCDSCEYRIKMLNLKNDY